mgnify:CR=1 FL=1
MKPVRIRFNKLGAAKFISHLDLNRTMIFALRRSRLPVWYTEGFNPHPYITFALALPLGAESLCEAMDFRVTDDSLSFNRIAARLRAQLPQSLRVYDAYAPVMKPSQIAFARYEIETENGRISRLLDDFFAQPEILIDKPLSKKRARHGGTDGETVDLKSKISDAAKTGAGFALTLPCGDTGSVSPKLVCAALSAYAKEEWIPDRVLRTGIFDKDMTPFR